MQQALLNDDLLNAWDDLVSKINAIYDVDQIWGKGFGDWVYEYKFRRGGKTLCTLYMKKDTVNILFTFGKYESEKFEEIRDQFSKEINKIYDNTITFHDDKWLWIPINYDWDDIQRLLFIKRRPNRK